MIRPHVVVFDLGKVLLDFDYSIAARKIAAKGKSVADNVKDFISQSPLLFQYETGSIDKQQFYDAICAATGYCGEITEFAAFFSDIFKQIEPMVELQAHLHRIGIPTYIFSNTNDLAISHIRSSFPFFANFDGYILSYECGVMKPDARIYEIVEQQTARQKAEILYLDDRAENIETGLARGWQALLHESSDKSRAFIEKLGLLETTLK